MFNACYVLFFISWNICSQFSTQERLRFFFFRYFLHIYSILITIFENLLKDKVQCLIFLMNYEHENKTKPVEVIITSGHYFL